MKKIFTILSVTLLAASASAQTLTVCDGTDRSGQMPVNGLYTDTQGTTSQMIYPADMLTDMQGMMINQIKFFPETTVGIAGCTLQLSLKEVEDNPFAEGTRELIADATVVATVDLTDANATELVFTLANPFEYVGGNLMVETVVSATNGNYKSTSFLGTTTESTTALNFYSWWSDTYELHSFLPKAEFTYEPADVTAIADIDTDKAVAGVRYYNMAGQQVANPSGLAIEVTTYTDGTTSSAKVVK